MIDYIADMHVLPALLPVYKQQKKLTQQLKRQHEWEKYHIRFSCKTSSVYLTSF